MHIMNKIIYIGIIIFCLFLTTAAGAADDATVTVRAEVLPRCNFLFSSPIINFGSLDPNSGVDANASTNLNLWCTKGMNFTIVDNNGLYSLDENTPRMKHETYNDYIPYTLNYEKKSGSGNGPSTPEEVSIFVTIDRDSYINAREGNYSDVVTISINP